MRKRNRKYSSKPLPRLPLEASCEKGYVTEVKMLKVEKRTRKNEMEYCSKKGEDWERKGFSGTRGKDREKKENKQVQKGYSGTHGEDWVQKENKQVQKENKLVQKGLSGTHGSGEDRVQKENKQVSDKEEIFIFMIALLKEIKEREEKKSRSSEEKRESQTPPLPIQKIKMKEKRDQLTVSPGEEDNEEKNELIRKKEKQRKNFKKLIEESSKSLLKANKKKFIVEEIMMKLVLDKKNSFNFLSSFPIEFEMFEIDKPPIPKLSIEVEKIMEELILKMENESNKVRESQTPNIDVKKNTEDFCFVETLCKIVDSSVSEKRIILVSNFKLALLIKRFLWKITKNKKLKKHFSKIIKINERSLNKFNYVKHMWKRNEIIIFEFNYYLKLNIDNYYHKNKENILNIFGKKTIMIRRGSNFDEENLKDIQRFLDNSCEIVRLK